MFECNDIAYNDPLALFQPEMTLTCYWVFIKKKGKMYVFPRWVSTDTQDLSVTQYRWSNINAELYVFRLNAVWMKNDVENKTLDERRKSVLRMCDDRYHFLWTNSLKDHLDQIKKEKVNKEDDRNRELKEWFIKSYPGYGIWSSESLLLCQEIFFER